MIYTRESHRDLSFLQQLKNPIKEVKQNSWGLTNWKEIDGGKTGEKREGKQTPNEREEADMTE